MGAPARPRTSPGRQVTLVSVAVVVIVVPDSFYGVVATDAWELMILRMLALIGVSLLAVLPWAGMAGVDVQRRLRRWSIPGVAASAIYLLSASPLYLFIGFCLLTGATVDVWMARAHIASEGLRARLRP